LFHHVATSRRQDAVRPAVPLAAIRSFSRKCHLPASAMRPAEFARLPSTAEVSARNAPTQTAAIRASITAYSTVVGPARSAKNRRIAGERCTSTASSPGLGNSRLAGAGPDRKDGSGSNTVSLYSSFAGDGFLPRRTQRTSSVAAEIAQRRRLWGLCRLDH